MFTHLRLAWKMQRWELIFFIGGCLLLSAAMAIVAWQLDASRDTVIACFEQPAETLSASCRSAIEWGNTLAGAIGILGAVATVAPFAAGIFLGAPLLSREIEHRTAPMAWSLSPSRRSWLAWRTVPLLVLLLLALLLLGQASAFLLETAEEGELGFRQFGMFGPILAARGLGVFGVGLLVGLAVGRVLPALLVTALATAAIVGGMSIGRDLLMREEAVWVPMGDQSEVVHMVFDSGFRSDATGEVITWEQAFNQYPDSFDEMTGEGGPPGMTSVWKVVPPDAFGLYVAREIGVLAVVFVVVGVATVGAVRVRRPE
ncbi:MAG: hypothetical protein ACRDGD_05085 [Candidatus Limnocylindria bacterium]